MNFGKYTYSEEHLRKTASIGDGLMNCFCGITDKRRLTFFPTETIVKGFYANLRHAPSKVRICAEPEI